MYYFDFEAPADQYTGYDDVGLSHAGELPYNFGGYQQRDFAEWEQQVGKLINLKLK